MMGRIGLLGKELRFGIGKVLVQFHVGGERLIKVGFHLAPPGMIPQTAAPPAGPRQATHRALRAPRPAPRYVANAPPRREHPSQPVIQSPTQLVA